jgi:formate hydrogenlyase subunit 6/NADH:ubiquinone oxidoreductase subunit I
VQPQKAQKAQRENHAARFREGFVLCAYCAICGNSSLVFWPQKAHKAQKEKHIARLREGFNLCAFCALCGNSF